MKKEEEKEKKKMTLKTKIYIGLGVVGIIAVGATVAYCKIPAFKGAVNGVFGKTDSPSKGIEVDKNEPKPTYFPSNRPDFKKPRRNYTDFSGKNVKTA